MSESVQILDVLIIGAGLSGLCAAKRIRDKCPSVSVKVCEKSLAAGGQLGGLKSRWITSNHFHAIELCRDLGVSLTGGGVGLGRGHALRHVTPFEGFVFGPLARMESDRLMAEMDSLCSTRFITEDLMNMDTFLCQKLLLNSSKEFFRFLIKISCGFYPIELSVTDWLKFCRSMSSTRNVYEMLMKDETHLAPAGGWDELVEALVEAVGLQNIAFSCKVTRVEHAQEDFVLVSDEKDTTWRAKTVICAVSCNDLLGIDFTPSRPLWLRAPNPTSNITHVTNFKARYQSSIWRDHGYSGHLFLPPYRMICFERDEKTLEGSFFHVENLNEDETRCAILNILSLQLKCRTLLFPDNFDANCQILPFYFEVPPCFSRRIVLSSSNVSCWFRGFINGSVQGGIKAAILALLEVRPQTISYRDVTEMQCLHFKYFQRCSTLERLWYSVNLSSLSRFVAVVGTVAASFTMLLRLVKNITGLDEIELE